MKELNEVSGSFVSRNILTLDLFWSSQQTKVYQYACHHSAEAHSKLMKSKEKVDAVKNSAVRKKKAEEKEKEVLLSLGDIRGVLRVVSLPYSLFLAFKAI